MKLEMTKWMLPIAAVCLVVFTGCKKPQRRPAQAREYYGVKVDWPKLDAEFANCDPDLKAAVRLTKRDFTYALFPKALIQLDKLSNSPNLTPPQKQLVSNLIEQTKEVLAKAPPAAGQ